MDKSAKDPLNAPFTSPPPDSASRYPLREYDVALSDLVGWTQTLVLERLGPPNSKSEGQTWSWGEGAEQKTFVRDNSGEIVQMRAFGITPKTIPVGTPYETWAYHNVRGATWELFFVKAEPGADQVVEVAQFSTGAVF